MRNGLGGARLLAVLGLVLGSALAAGSALAHSPEEVATKEPAGRGDQVIFYYDVRADYTTFLNLRNESTSEVTVSLDFYGGSPFGAAFKRNESLAAGATKIIDAGDLKGSGLAAGAGVAFATVVNGTTPIVSRALSGNFTVANLKTNSAWGAAGAARSAVQIDAEDNEVVPAPGTAIDGVDVLLRPIHPTSTTLATFYDPQTLQPAADGGNQIIFVSFNDVPGASFSVQSATTNWAVSAVKNDGSALPATTFEANGVQVSNLVAVAGDGVNGQSGGINFAANSGGAQTRMIFFTESLQTFGTGYLLPATEVSFSAQVQPILTASCATSQACHQEGGAPGNFSAGAAYANLVNADAAESDKPRVAPFDLANSYMFDKITGAPGSGTQMPLGGAPLAANEIQAIRTWILEGAPNN